LQAYVFTALFIVYLDEFVGPKSSDKKDIEKGNDNDGKNTKDKPFLPTVKKSDSETAQASIESIK